jgi:DNA-binding NarL/FixJ family response regulator
MAVAQTIRVLVVDDHSLLRSGIAAVIGAAKDVLGVGEATNGQEAIESFRAHRPDVTLMDLQMPVMNGIDAIVAVRKEFANARFIVLTTYDGDVQALRALKAGATGYLLKGMLREELVDTIRAIHAGRRKIPSEIAAGIAEHVADDALTRVIEVLRRGAPGTPNKVIAGELSLAEVTVKIHLKSIFSKLGANDRTHAVTIATKRGFLDG